MGGISPSARFSARTVHHRSRPAQACSHQRSNRSLSALTLAVDPRLTAGYCSPSRVLFNAQCVASSRSVAIKFKTEYKARQTYNASLRSTAICSCGTA